MYKVIIELKKDISDETLKELTTIINKAFDNRDGKVVGTKTNSPYCFEFSGDQDKYNCLDLSVGNLKKIELFWENVGIWRWEEDDERKSRDLVVRIINILFEMNDEELEVYYPEDDWKRGYDDLTTFMKEHGFELKNPDESLNSSKERLFESRKYLLDSQINEIIIKLTEKHPWTHKCIENVKDWESLSIKGILLHENKEKSSDE